LERNSILKIENLHVSYGPIKALKDISLEVNEGEIVVLIGANGAEKTTLLQTILGINPKDSGSIFFMDKDITYSKTE
jgi:branched-chain amino acid transport system ATP-binding protein